MIPVPWEVPEATLPVVMAAALTTVGCARGRITANGSEGRAVRLNAGAPGGRGAMCAIVGGGVMQPARQTTTS